MARLRMQLMAGMLSGPPWSRRVLHTIYLIVDSVAGHSDDMHGVCHRLGESHK